MPRLPKVSCILPCGYARRFARTAIECFKSQDYPGELELVIVDNGGDRSSLSGRLWNVEVRYLISEKISVAELRNLGTSQASGDICITWDEDDWSHPTRVSEQVHRLILSQKAVTGWHNILYYDEFTAGTYKYFYSPGAKHPPYAMGTSQC